MAHAEAHKLFKKAVLRHFAASGRHHLPWRKLQTPYRVLVSELMLQQTQVDRVVPKFNAFTKRFPDWKRLAAASLPQVYGYWQGLGYNRRAKYLRDAAKLVRAAGTDLPNDEAFIRSLPGVGPYTAGAVRAFAYGEPAPFIETNIRTAILYNFFPDDRTVSDAELLAILEQLKPVKGKRARDWYAALMDYGAHLKRQGVKLNSKTRGYAKQSKFEGSLRQVRGAMLRELAGGGKSKAALKKKIGRKESDIDRALLGLSKDGLVLKRGRIYTLST